MSGEQTERRIQEPGGNGSGAGRIARQPDVAARYLRALGEDSEEAYSSSSSSSSKSPAGATAPRVCTRAWRRMLLKTLKLRPHPSTGHTKATAVSVSCVAGRKSGQTFFSGVAIEMDLRWGEPEDRIREGGSHLQAARAVEAFPTIRALVLGTAGVGWGV